MPYISLTTTEPDGQWEVRPYMDENRHPRCHVTLVQRGGGVHTSLIVSIPEAGDLIEALTQAMEGMRDLDSHPALAERD